MLHHQLTLPLGPICRRVPDAILPKAAFLNKYGAELMMKVLSRGARGGTRSHCDYGRLASSMQSRGRNKIICQDIYMPIPAHIDFSLVEQQEVAFLKRRNETPGHRRLKILGQLMLGAGSLSATVLDEVPILASGTTVIADLMRVSQTEKTALECGATDGRSILAFLEANIDRVIVLPFASLYDRGLRGYAFQRKGTPDFPVISYQQVQTSLSEMTNAAPSRQAA